MKRKLPTLLTLLVMVLLGAMYWVDLSYFTDAATGFPVAGGVLLRYLALALPLAMALLGLRTVGPGGVEVLRVRQRPLALAFVLAAAAGVALGATQVVMALQAASLYLGLMGLGFAWYGVWMFLCALQLLVQMSPTPTLSALLGALAALPYCVLAVFRVMVRPTSLWRLGPFVHIFAAMLAMLWLVFLLRALYTSMSQGRARAMYVLGLLCFLFCTCLELPQAAFSALFGQMEALSMMESVNMALFGIAAGGTSVALAGMTEARAAVVRADPSKAEP